MSLEVKISLSSKMYWLFFTWISHVNGNVEHVMALSNKSWRTRVGKSGAYHKMGVREEGEEWGVGTRGIWESEGGGGIGKGGSIRNGKTGEQAGPLPTPTCSTVC